MATGDRIVSRLLVLIAVLPPFSGCATHRKADLSPSDKEILASMQRIMGDRVIEEIQIPIRRSGSDLVFIPPRAKTAPLPMDFPFPFALEYDEGNLIVRFPAP